jgi:hypothetical protein
VLPFKKFRMSTKKQPPKTVSVKKEFKKEIAVKLDAALIDLKSRLGDKEFQHRLKKAAKVFAHNLHGKDFSENGHNGKKTEKPAPAKNLKSAKKASPKKKAVAAE